MLDMILIIFNPFGPEGKPFQTFSLRQAIIQHPFFLLRTSFCFQYIENETKKNKNEIKKKNKIKMKSRLALAMMLPNYTCHTHTIKQ